MRNPKRVTDHLLEWPHLTNSRLPLAFEGNVTDTTTNDEAWFYTHGGQRKGPVPADKLRELLSTQAINGETLVWRRGLADWQPLRATELGTELKDAPPPVAGTHINNSLVWILAFAPIAYLFIEITILGYQLNNPDLDHSFLSSLIWIIPLLANGGLCLLDERQLKLAGYTSGWMTFFAIVLAPVYLFMRAKHLRQAPSYGFVWIGSFILSFIVRVI